MPAKFVYIYLSFYRIPDMDISVLPLVFVLGVCVGFINVLAAGGSFITLAVLMWLGLPPTVANGTNRVGLLIQNSFASFRFNKLKLLKKGFALKLAGFTIAGSLLGSYMATQISDVLFKKIVGLLMVLVSLITIYDPRRFAERFKRFRNLGVLGFVFFLIGVYGGFVQAGVGFFIIAASILSGLSMVEANAIKVFLITLYTVTVLPVFILSHKVNLIDGVVLGLGSMLGATFAIKLSLKKGDSFIRAALLILLFVFAVKLMFF